MIILFDFDGTIADTLDETINIFNELSGKFGYNKVSFRNKHVWRSKPSSQVVRDLGIPFFKFPFVVKDARMKLNERIEKIKPIKGLKEVLSTLSKNNELAILSSNSEDNIRKFLKKNNLDYFTYIFPECRTFGKARKMRKILADFKVSEVVYVCDETRDVEAAKNAGLKSIAVTWGFNSHTALEKAKPDSIVDRPQDLLRVLTKH